MRFPCRPLPIAPCEQQEHTGAYSCKLPYCDKRFPTAAARNQHMRNSADHAPFRFQPLEALQRDETDVAGVVASTVDLLIRRVEYNVSTGRKMTDKRCAGCGRVRVCAGVCGCVLACV